MSRVRDRAQRVSDLSALCKSFNRAPVRIWRELLRLSSKLLEQSGHVAIDATYFDVNRHRITTSNGVNETYEPSKRRFSLILPGRGYRRSWKYKVAQWDEHGPQVALRNAGGLLSLADNKGYDVISFHEELRSEGVRPLIKHRIFALMVTRTTRGLRHKLYNQRSICETVNSVIKRSYGSAVRVVHGTASFVR